MIGNYTMRNDLSNDVCFVEIGCVGAELERLQDMMEKWIFSHFRKCRTLTGSSGETKSRTAK